jgi:regulator of protease activity HflC (stomatin/prohibitin superfamily)
MGISGLISTIALLAFLLFLAGIGLVVLSASQGRPVRGGVLLAIIGLIAGIVLTIVGQGIITLQPTEIAIVANTLTGELLEPRRGGTHVILPIVQNVIVRFDTVQQEYTMSGSILEGAETGNDSVEIQTVDGQLAAIDVTINFRVNPDPVAVNRLYSNWRDRDYVAGFVRPATRSIVRDVASSFTAADLYGERNLVGDGMQEALTIAFEEEGLELREFFLREIRFSDAYQETLNLIEQERRRTELLRVEAEQRLVVEQGEAAAREARAEGDAAVARALALGEADATRTRAEAEAAALEFVSAELQANPSLIQYLYVQNLSDNINLALIPSNSPFLFDLNTLTEQAAGTSTQSTTEEEETPQETPESTPQPGG